MGKTPLAFLLTKYFHPMTKENQRKLWIAEEKAKDDAKKAVLRKKQLEEEQAMWAGRDLYTLTDEERKKKQLGSVAFMYQPPPGYAEMIEKQKRDEAEAKAEAKAEAQALAEGRPVEKTWKQKREERFKFLKNAPVEGGYTDGHVVRHRPLGIEVRNIQCNRCHEWGHQSTDRECPMNKFNPNDAFRQQLEDPLQLVKSRAAELGHGSGYADPMAAFLDEPDPERAFLASLTRKQKRALLRHLNKLEKAKAAGEAPSDDSSSSSSSESSSDSDSSSDSERERKRRRKHKKEKRRKRRSKDAKEQKRAKVKTEDAEPAVKIEPGLGAPSWPCDASLRPRDEAHAVPHLVAIKPDPDAPTPMASVATDAGHEQQHRPSHRDRTDRKRDRDDDHAADRDEHRARRKDRERDRAADREHREHRERDRDDGDREERDRERHGRRDHDRHTERERKHSAR
eukprot:TRINITY_DN3876_c0_g1_i2.p1 TRINITY_DN3876_c0_g1~~TRINITY_DN3876_c0_g1_i2.p1  ORF type:complete len:454 (+),score=99.25 TRINITY_DN3876_c0_g1_i2:112-1473(+)